MAGEPGNVDARELTHERRDGHVRKRNIPAEQVSAIRQLSVQLSQECRTGRSMLLGKSPNAAERMDARELPTVKNVPVLLSCRKDVGPTSLRLNLRLR